MQLPAQAGEPQKKAGGLQCTEVLPLLIAVLTRRGALLQPGQIHLIVHVLRVEAGPARQPVVGRVKGADVVHGVKPRVKTGKGGCRQ